MSYFRARVAVSARSMASCLGEGDSTSTEPFAHLKLSSWDPLRAVKGRSICASCNCSRKFYCYTCYDVVGIDRSLLPTVKLPVNVDIIKHPQEVAGKSTAIHARILSPSDVTIHIFPDVPDSYDLTRTVLVYPSEDALTVEELAGRLKECSTVGPVAVAKDTDTQPPGSCHGDDSSYSRVWRHLQKVVFIDSTWQQSNKIYRDERMKRLTCVKLASAQTHFWRPQRKTTSHLATIEAFYYFFRDMEAAMSSTYNGYYDNLLYFYVYQYGIVERAKSLKEMSSPVDQRKPRECT